MEGNTRGSSSPAKPALQVRDPLLMTTTFSSSIFRLLFVSIVREVIVENYPLSSFNYQTTS